MPSAMTRNTNGDPISRIVSPGRVGSPRLRVVHMDATTARTAVLARPVVTNENRSAVRDVLRVLEVGISQRRTPALPIGVSGTNQVRVCGWAATGQLGTPADRCFVFLRERAPSERSRDIRPLTCGNNTAGRSRLANPRRTDLRSHIGALGWVVTEIGPSGSAGVRTEPKPASFVGGPALFANTSRHKTEFTTWN